MQRQREEARRSWVGSGEAATEAVWFALREEVGATEFLGYETETAEGVVQAVMRDGQRVTEAEAGDDIGVIVNQTPFYAESGGQMGDSGVIFSSGRGVGAIRLDTAPQRSLSAEKPASSPPCFSQCAAGAAVAQAATTSVDAIARRETTSGCSEKCRTSSDVFATTR